jgi:glutathione S-transferase
MTIRIHAHPASTTSRAVMLFAADSGIAYKLETVDIFSGQHMGAAYAALNPNRLVPMLEDGDFRLTETSAILKFLADTFASPCYPSGLQARARVNERMDWFNTQFNRDLGYGFVYPQIFPQYKRQSDPAHQATLTWHAPRARQWLDVLDRHFLGEGNAYVCGGAITLADYLGAPMVAIAEVAKVDYAPYPHVRRWLATMKQSPHWGPVFSAIDGYAASLASNRFEPL